MGILKYSASTALANTGSTGVGWFDGCHSRMKRRQRLPRADCVEEVDLRTRRLTETTIYRSSRLADPAKKSRNSIGKGKTIVELFSLASTFNVDR